MDERYWIVNDCIETLKRKSPLSVWRRELEVKFLQLRVELLKCESGVPDAPDVMPYQGLELLVQKFLADGHTHEICPEILSAADELLDKVRNEVNRNPLEY